MAFIRYPIAIERIEQGFRVVVPDFPGCVGVGDNVNEAINRAQEAMVERIKELVEKGQPIPEPTWLSHVEADPAYAGWDFGLIMADVSLWRPEIVN